MTLMQLIALMVASCSMVAPFLVDRYESIGDVRNDGAMRAHHTTGGMMMTDKSGLGTTRKLRYLVTFGDSYSQTGFNTTGAVPSSTNPLGNPPLPGWTTSGGLNWIGYLVSKLNKSETLSYNFAYGGATTSASLVEPYEPTVLNFDNQTSEFSHYLASLPRPLPWEARNSLVGVWIGVNDVGNSYYKPNVPELYSEIMMKYFNLLQKIHDLGFKNFLILSVPPIYKTPLMLAQPVSAQQLEANAVLHYNDLLSAHLNAFVKDNDGVTARTVDTRKAFDKVIDDPVKYGASNATCYNADGVTCLWWNNYHPGHAIHALVAREVLTEWASFWHRRR